MSYTKHTWFDDLAGGTPVTAAKLNEIEDGIEAAHTHLENQGLLAAIPAAGNAGRLYFATDKKVLYRDNGTDWDVVPTTDTLGAAGTFLKVNAAGDGLEYGNATSSDGAVVRRFAAQSIPNDTVAAISFDDEVHDVGGYYNPAAPTRLTVPAGKAGYYVVLGFACLGPNGVGMRQGILAHNGAHFRIVSFLPPNASNPAGQMVSGRRYLGVGDYVELMVTQNSGGALDTPAGGTWGVPRSPSLDLYYLGA